MSIPGFPHAMPVEGFLGGILIGAAAALMLLGSGRIAGISGIAARALTLNKSSLPIPAAWLFLAGLVFAAFLIDAYVVPVQSSFPPSTALLVAGGLLVGVGTQLGSGCTSGHGVCGMSRLSPRSLIATATFITSGMATVAITNALGWGW
ncbi:YeeE/YedE family protein [Erythrobacter crassostreae]|uniref:YeeE/YedE family protein n=1 Tax=Erythrobacter crassostreae TaxID=2828328 RepID=A0A9X1F451_9SPHN|nr:YeeE/YedE thiosulfate transporter family protein [Erythrobacter crassostrea]MBV7258470.1 YeeE/YedE family protein [Erythrobacter crassostrea]